METWINNVETVPVYGYKCITQFKRHDIRAEGIAIFEKITPPLWKSLIFLMKLDKQNLAKKMLFILPASESCVDVCAAE
jgi:hypothetical protein